MFEIGSTVKNKFNSRIATVTGILDDGIIHVRFDGDTDIVALHHTRFEKHTVSVNAPSAGPNPKTFKRGDYIQVTDSDGLMVSGAALNMLGTSGYATFDILTDDGRVLGFNSNFDKFVVLFRADIARGDDPKY